MFYIFGKPKIVGQTGQKFVFFTLNLLEILLRKKKSFNKRRYIFGDVAKSKENISLEIFNFAKINNIFLL